MAGVTPTSLCNVALRRIGAKSIKSLDTDHDREAEICRELYHDARRTVLSMHNWNAAKRAAQLTVNSDVTPTFWDYAFTLPDDYVRLISVHPSDDLNSIMEYSLQDANDSDADLVLMVDASTCYIQYIFDATDLNIMGQGFRDCLAFVLARDLASALDKSAALKTLTAGEMRRALLLAKSVDGMEEYPERLAEGSWVKARSGLRTDRFIIDE